MKSAPSLIVSALLAFSATSALAHSGNGIPGGFESGFEHPIRGWDHMVAMGAVGL